MSKATCIKIRKLLINDCVHQVEILLLQILLHFHGLDFPETRCTMPVGSRTVWLDLWEGIQNQYQNNHFTHFNKHNNYTPLCQMFLWVLFENQWVQLSAFAAGEKLVHKSTHCSCNTFSLLKQKLADASPSNGVLPIGAFSLTSAETEVGDTLEHS